MATYRVWGEWQDFEDALELEASCEEAAASEFVALDTGDMFPDWNDCDKATLRVLDEEDVSDDDGFDAKSVAVKVTVTLRIKHSFDIKRVRW